MSFFGKPFAVAVSAVALSGAALAPLGLALSAGAAQAQPLPEATRAAEPSTPLSTPRATQALIVEQPGNADDSDQIRNGGLRDEVATPDSDAPVPARSQVVDAELTCLAKVVLHESGNQPRAGQLAVAQVVMNRVNDSRGRFGRTICGVVGQRGQFFNVNAYNPRRDVRWFQALEVARQARDGNAAPVMEGALFFHAAYAGPFRGRVRVGRIAGHIFYR
jgi:spore germination cell wall hydrolase CwlJ-like protein